MWDFRTITPLERPADLADRATLSADEAAAAFEAGFAGILTGEELAPFPGANAADFELWADGMIGTRLIPLDSRPPAPPELRQWQGHSRGAWNGDTLVVETTGFEPRVSVQGSGPDLRLVEPFTRVDADTLRYEFTMDDPASFTAPWSAMVSMRSTDAQVWEYACHEGNYSMPLILGSGRALEQKSLEQGSSEPR